MTITFSDVLTPRTREAIYGQIVADLDADLIANGLPAVSAGWLPGNILRTMIRVVSVAVSVGDGIVALFASGATLGTITDRDVGVVRCSGYEQVQAIQADYAAGFVTVTNLSGATVEILAGVETFRNPVSKYVYTATASRSIVAGGYAIVPIVGPVKGIAADTAAGSITELVRVRSGVTCNNTAAVLGVADESLAALIDRSRRAPIARQAAATYSKFTDAALDVAGHGVAVNRVQVRRVTSGSGAGTVLVRIARASGVVSGGDVATVLAYVIARALGDSGSVAVQSATGASLADASILLWAWSTDARTDAQIVQDVSTAIAEELATIPIGGYEFGATRIYPTDRISTVIQSRGLVQSDGVPPDLGLLASDVVIPGNFAYSVKRVSK